jgi:hypothetical protein
VDVLLLPFRVVPELPMYMALMAALPLATFPVLIGVSRLIYGAERTAEAVPQFGRFVVICAILAPLILYAMTFVFMVLFGYQS